MRELVGRRRNGIKRRVGRTVRERKEKVMKRSKERNNGKRGKE